MNNTTKIIIALAKMGPTFDIPDLYDLSEVSLSKSDFYPYLRDLVNKGLVIHDNNSDIAGYYVTPITVAKARKGLL